LRPWIAAGFSAFKRARGPITALSESGWSSSAAACSRDRGCNSRAGGTKRYGAILSLSFSLAGDESGYGPFARAVNVFATPLKRHMRENIQHRLR